MYTEHLNLYLKLYMYIVLKNQNLYIVPVDSVPTPVPVSSFLRASEAPAQKNLVPVYTVNPGDDNDDDDDDDDDNDDNITWPGKPLAVTGDVDDVTGAALLHPGQELPDHVEVAEDVHAVDSNNLLSVLLLHILT